jgi:hypothetical protein
MENKEKDKKHVPFGAGVFRKPKGYYAKARGAMQEKSGGKMLFMKRGKRGAFPCIFLLDFPPGRAFIGNAMPKRGSLALRYCQQNPPPRAGGG